MRSVSWPLRRWRSWNGAWINLRQSRRTEASAIWLPQRWVPIFSKISRRKTEILDPKLPKKRRTIELTHRVILRVELAIVQQSDQGVIDFDISRSRTQDGPSVLVVFLYNQMTFCNRIPYIPNTTTRKLVHLTPHVSILCCGW